MIKKVIGGEFDIDIQQTLHNSNTFTEGYLYSSGRAALYNILLHVKSNEQYTHILLPDYLCSSVLEAVEKSGLSTIFYKISEDLTPDLDNLINKIDSRTVVLIINYFGCINCNSITKHIKRFNNNTPVIQDNVQALFDMYNDSYADYTFTSFRKTLQAPDGAWVKTKKLNMPCAEYKNTFAEYKIAGGILKYMALTAQANINDNLYLDLFKKGEDKINENFNAAPSSTSLAIMQEFERVKAASVRKENATTIIDGFKDLNIDVITKIEDNYIPLFIPVRLSDRDKVRSTLFKYNIYCPVHWPVPENYNLARGKELAANELSVIIDQRYTKEDMYRILDVIKKYYSYEI